MLQREAGPRIIMHRSGGRAGKRRKPIDTASAAAAVTAAEDSVAAELMDSTLFVSVLLQLSCVLCIEQAFPWGRGKIIII
jgi:hypothetical protein